jgi:hypothetical protein
VPEPDLQPDDVVSGIEERLREIEQDPKAPDLVALIGFLGEAPNGDPRLFADDSMNRWIQLRADDIVARERLPEGPGGYAPRTVIWVKGNVMRAEFGEEVPERLQLEFLNDRAELWFEPPRSLLEVAQYLKIEADLAYYGMTRRTRRPTWHC